MFTRTHAGVLKKRLAEPRRFIQVVAGPRQVGKTTLVRQVLERSRLEAHYASADEPTLRGRHWLEEQWDAARLKARDAGKRGAILAIDEAQKIPDWSETVKRLWDEDTAGRLRLKVIILGSGPAPLPRGPSEGLTRRFERRYLPPLSLAEWRGGVRLGDGRYFGFCG